jgi:hypothetical protein
MNYLIRLAKIQNQSIKLLNYFFIINRLINHIDTSALNERDQGIFNLYKAFFVFGKSKIFLNSNLKKESINILNNHSTSADLVQHTLANYLLAKIFFDVERSPKLAKGYFERLKEKFPGNKIFKEYCIACN